MPNKQSDKEFLSDVMALYSKLKQRGILPDTLRVNPKLLTPKRLPYFAAECKRLGIKLKIDYAR